MIKSPVTTSPRDIPALWPFVALLRLMTKTGFWLSPSPGGSPAPRPTPESLDCECLGSVLEMRLFLPILLLLGVCQHGLSEPSVAPTVSEAKQDVEEAEQACRNHQMFTSEALGPLGGSIERLGLQLLEQLPVGPQQPNVLISPFSVSLALAQLALGARNETKQLLLKSLHGNSISCYHHTMGGLLRHLSHSSLQVATRVYLRQGFDVKLSFIEKSMARYQSSPAPLTSVEDVNQWVKNATNGKIGNFMESIPHNVVLMLINAVHFKGEWLTRFDPSDTSKGLFYVDDQNSVSVDMMRSPKYPLRLLHDAELEATVACFPFKGNKSFLVVQPIQGKGNVSSLLPKLNISELYSRLPAEHNMQVAFPKFRLQYRQELQEPLTSLGLGSLFSGPDLSGIMEEPLKVSAVRHASQVELSEEGAEASATTVITALRSVSFFSLNGPFFFALVDDVSLTPLFMGVVTNPVPDEALMPNDEPRDNVTHSAEPVTDATELKGVVKEQSDDPVAAEVNLQSDLGPSGATAVNGHVPPPLLKSANSSFSMDHQEHQEEEEAKESKCVPTLSQPEIN
ncbi:Alpha-2-antiplasmin [Merluccius polli]|uniref:Alpha-2-antiplasmin n=1 Tax=Merluccius polli TaxID=89951 RepID=A0AA47NRE3_MERPO|nr:Alpha-2-antiplasmin [Merluccius polli]